MFHITTPANGEAESGLFRAVLNGEKAPVLPLRVSAYPYNYGWPGYQRPIEQSEEAAMLSFEGEGEALLTVTADRNFTEAVVRPQSKGVVPQICGRSVTLTLPAPGQYTLELDGHHSCLHLFYDPPAVPVPDGENVLRFTPGVHRVGKVQLHSGQTVVIERGARVIGGFFAVDAENIRITGGGILDGSYEERRNETLMLAVDVEKWAEVPHTEPEFLAFAERTKLMVGCLKFYHCRNCVAEGVTLVDSATWTAAFYGCRALHIDNVKIVGQWKYNTDGIDLVNCSDVLVERCFLRCFDDCMVVKGIKGWDRDNVRNIVMRSLVVWCDWGRALEIGAETCADEYRDLLFEDCDVIHAMYAMLDIQNGDRAEVRDVAFRNIRCEFTKYQQQDVLQTDMSVPYDFSIPARQPRLVFIHGYTGQWSKDGIAGKTEGVRFENITLYSDVEALVPEFDLCGFAEGKGISGVSADGIFLGGKRLSENELYLNYGRFTEKISVL